MFMLSEEYDRFRWYRNNKYRLPNPFVDSRSGEYFKTLILDERTFHESMKRGMDEYECVYSALSGKAPRFLGLKIGRTMPGYQFAVFKHIEAIGELTSEPTQCR